MLPVVVALVGPLTFTAIVVDAELIRCDVVAAILMACRALTAFAAPEVLPELLPEELLPEPHPAIKVTVAAHRPTVAVSQGSLR